MSQLKSSEYGTPSPMIYGLGANSKAGNLVSSHPLESSEKTYLQKKEHQEYAMLRKIQGLHAPLRLQMERKIIAKTGHLPFLPRYNASLDVLSGRDELITFEDFLGHPHEPENMGQPHAMVEKHMFGLL